MLFKVQRCFDSSDFIIYDYIKSINFGKAFDNDYSTPKEQLSSAVWLEVHDTADDDRNGIEYIIYRKMDLKGPIDTLTVSDTVSLLFKRDLYYNIDTSYLEPIKHFMSWVDITDTDNKRHFIAFDGDGYICNDKGKTIEAIR